MRHQELRFQRVEAKKVLGKFDELYDFIRNSGLHYKISENFGCTVITVGRNFHRYSDVYKDLRNAPALESQTSLNLNLVISELESARQNAAYLKEEAQFKLSVLENELYQKNKIIEELENVQKGAFELEKVTEELSNVKKELHDTIESNANNILKITGLEHKLSEAEKVISSKSKLIEELKAGNDKEGVPKPILAKIANLQVKLGRAESDLKTSKEIIVDYQKENEELNHEVDRLMAIDSKKSADKIQSLKKELSDLNEAFSELHEKLAEESIKAEAANEKAKNYRDELNDLIELNKTRKGKETLHLDEPKKTRKEKETSDLESKLEEVTNSLKEETKMKERCWEIMDLHNAEMEALKEEKKSLTKRLAGEIEKNDILKEADLASTATSTPAKLEPTEDSGLEYSLMSESLETFSKQGAVKRDLAETGLYPQHPMVWGRPREPRNQLDIEDSGYPGGLAACASCSRKLPPSKSNPMGSFIPEFRDHDSFWLSNFLDSCESPWLHYGYCHHCLHEARLKDEHRVREHAKSCGALEQVYGDCSDSIRSAYIFYAETENAIRHGIDEHKAYKLIRQRLSECADEGSFFVPDMAYRQALWMLNKDDQEEKEDSTDDSEDEASYSHWPPNYEENAEESERDPSDSSEEEDLTPSH